MSDLEHEIQRLLDAGESPSEKLAEALESEPELRRAALEMEQLDAVLGEWAAAPLELDQDVFVRRIAQRLDEALSPLEHDPTLPPAFDDEDSWRRAGDEHSGEFALDALTGQLSEPEVAASAAAPGKFARAPAMEPQPAGNVVRMEPKKQTWVFAAAAVVGLVAAGGIFVLSGTGDEATVAIRSHAMVQESASEAPSQGASVDDYAPAPAVAGNVEGTAEPEPERDQWAAAEESEEQVLAVTGAEDHLGAPGGAAAEVASTMTSSDRLRGMSRRRASMAAPIGRHERAADPAKTTVVRRTRARVFGCFDSPPDAVRARVWVDGRTGRVREVDVPSGGRPAEVECVRRAVRAARFPVRAGVARYTTTLEYER